MQDLIRLLTPLSLLVVTFLELFFFQVGLLKSESLDSPTKDSSPFKEIMQTLEKPPTEGGLPTRKAPGPPGRHLNSPPRSADYYNKGHTTNAMLLCLLLGKEKQSLTYMDGWQINDPYVIVGDIFLFPLSHQLLPLWGF